MKGKKYTDTTPHFHEVLNTDWKEPYQGKKSEPKTIQHHATAPPRNDLMGSTDTEKTSTSMSKLHSSNPRILGHQFLKFAVPSKTSVQC